jgi:hypothetical protein
LQEKKSDFPASENQFERLAGILACDIRFRSRLPVVGCRHTLNNLAIYDNVPDSTAANPGQTGDEIVDMSSLFHFLSLFLFLSFVFLILHYLSAIASKKN